MEKGIVSSLSTELQIDDYDIRQNISGLKIVKRTFLAHRACGKTMPAVEEIIVDWSPRKGLSAGSAFKVMWALSPFVQTHLDGVANPVFHYSLVYPAPGVKDGSAIPEEKWLQYARTKIALAFDAHWGLDKVDGLFTGLRHK